MQPATDRVNPFINRQPLTGGGRDAFLARVRKGLNHPHDVSPAPTEPPPTRDESLVRQVNQESADRIERWVLKARANTMVVHRVAADSAAVAAAVDTCLAAHPISRALLNTRDLESRYPFAAHLAGKNITVLQWGAANCKDLAFSCEAAITDCRAGLADTGALLVWSDQSFGRSSTLVVQVHVILLPASRILPDLIDGLALVTAESAGTLPSNIIVINGPSKTADIEMNLVTGVHGPKNVYVIVIDGI